MIQHAGLSPERWAQFSLDQQILMIANEMNRGAKLLTRGPRTSQQASHERVLALVDLTVGANEGTSLRRELLRWRELFAELYLAPAPDATTCRELLVCLLRFTPEAAKQIPLLEATRRSHAP